ncbi:MAG: hypothetical protein ACI362_00410 [Coriobacteriales bacterium]
MSDTEDKIPFNLVGAQDDADPANIAREELAEREAISLEEWSKRNLPDHKITFRWRYDNKKIQLYERRLHSLASFNVGPAIQAWARSRMEWMRDEKLFELPDGVLVFSIDPEADIDIQLEPQREAPTFTIDDLEWVGDELDGSDLAGSVWVARNGELSIFPQPIRHAADTLVRDLAQAFGLQIVDAHLTPTDLEDAEIFHVSDEFGIIGCEGKGGPVTDKMAQSFDKLWALK